MSKYSRQNVGSIIKGRDGKSDYLKINVKEALVLQSGDILNLESKAQQKTSLEAAIAAGKLSGESAEKALARVDKIPEFVRFEVIKVTKN